MTDERFRLPSRRRLLLGAGSALVLAACGSSNDDTSPSTTRSEGDDALFLGARFPDGGSGPSVFVPGVALRAPFVLINTGGGALFGADAPPELEVTVTGPSGDTVLDRVIERRADGQPTAYFPVEFTPTETGIYEVSSPQVEGSRTFEVTERSAVPIPLVGDALPPVDTPTFDDARGVSPICTRPEPCPFHEVTLTEALAEPGPTVLLIATPGFCTTDVCGPSVDLLIELADELPAGTSVVHAEVFADPQNDPSLTTALVNAYQMGFEPSLYVADESNTIVSAVHWAFERRDMRDAFGRLS